MAAQYLVNSVAAGCGIALVAVGFGLIYRTTRIFHFAHGAVYLIGAYAAYAMAGQLKWPIGVAWAVATAMSGIAGCLVYWGIYRPLQARGASSLVLLVSSIGLLIVVQNLAALFFGNGTVILRTGAPQEGMVVFGARITGIQIAIIVTSIFVAMVLWAWLQFSRVGVTVRAIANDLELSRTVGVRIEMTVLCVFAIGSMLAGASGIVISYDTDLNPMMGFHALLLAIVAVIVGGTRNVAGALFGGVVVGCAQHFGVWTLPTQWQDAIVFLILIAFLLFRPEGVLGGRIRRAQI